MLYNDKKQKLLDSFNDYTENEYNLDSNDYVFVRDCWNWWKFYKRIDTFDANDLWDDYIEENINYDYTDYVYDIEHYIKSNGTFVNDIKLNYKKNFVYEAKKRINSDF